MLQVFYTVLSGNIRKNQFSECVKRPFEMFSFSRKTSVFFLRRHKKLIIKLVFTNFIKLSCTVLQIGMLKCHKRQFVADILRHMNDEHIEQVVIVSELKSPDIWHNTFSVFVTSKEIRGSDLSIIFLNFLLVQSTGRTFF